MTLPGALVSALEEVSQGEPFPWVWLATFDPERGAQVRTLRTLAYNLRQGLYTFACHARHAKLRQLGADPRGQLCLLRRDPLLQMRLDVRLESRAASEHPLGERMWQKVTPRDRRALYAAHPQAPLPPAEFCLLEARVVRGERLVLGGEEAERCEWLLDRSEPGLWHERMLAP